jgi:hypothetical protein
MIQTTIWYSIIITLMWISIYNDNNLTYDIVFIIGCLRFILTSIALLFCLFVLVFIPTIIAARVNLVKIPRSTYAKMLVITAVDSALIGWMIYSGWIVLPVIVIIERLLRIVTCIVCNEFFTFKFNKI